MTTIPLKSIPCVGFDGKKGHSRAKNCKKEVLDKYTVVSQPEAKYVDHFVPRAGTALAISNDLLHVLEKYNSEDSITALLCDGCAVNTGLEKVSNKKINKFECPRDLSAQWRRCLRRRTRRRPAPRL